MKKTYIFALLGFAIALTASAQLVQTIPGKADVIRNRQIMEATMEATISKNYPVEQIPIADDMKRFYDLEKNNICYIYHDQAISCLKN